VAGGLAVAAAAGLVATIWLRDVRPGARAVATAPSVAARATGVAAASSAGPARLAGDVIGMKTVQVVLRAPDARRVSVVGDFNGWDAHADVMTRDAATSLWSHSMALRPGRHVYAFVVDDSVWMRDPRSPAAPDADFGRPGSVLLVGQP
jgi:1,4-alpha-glucan branching enzyme